MDFTKRFSIAHPEKDMENCPNHYYLILNYYSGNDLFENLVKAKLFHF